VNYFVEYFALIDIAINKILTNNFSMIKIFWTIYWVDKLILLQLKLLNLLTRRNYVNIVNDDLTRIRIPD